MKGLFIKEMEKSEGKGGTLGCKRSALGHIINSMGNSVPNKIAVFRNGKFWKFVDRLAICWSNARTPMLLKVYENILEIHLYDDRVGFITALPQNSFVIIYEKRVAGVHVNPENFSTHKTKKVCSKEKAGLNFDLGYPSQRRVLLGALVALAHHIANDNDGFINYDELELNHILPIEGFRESIWPQHVELCKHYKNVEHWIIWKNFRDKGLIITDLSIMQSTFKEIYGLNKIDVCEDTLLEYGLDFLKVDNPDDRYKLAHLGYKF